MAEKLPKLARNELKQEKSRHIAAILLPIGLPAPISRETNDFNRRIGLGLPATQQAQALQPHPTQQQHNPGPKVNKFRKVANEPLKMQ